jgi:hypothetical protein
MFLNAADAATIAVPGSMALTPPSRLQNQHTSVRCRVEAASMAITVDLLTATLVDTFGLFGIGSSLYSTIGTATSRVRASLTDATALDGAIFDSGSAAGRISPYYGNLVALKDGAASTRYIRFDIAQTSATYLEAGFLMTGARNQVTINFAIGASDAPVDPSIVTTTRSGADWVDERNRYREWDFNFEWLTTTERFTWVEDLDQLIGASKNVMIIRNCASANLGRDTLCGRITNGAPVISRNGYFNDGPAYSRAYKIKQRL